MEFVGTKVGFYKYFALPRPQVTGLAKRPHLHYLSDGNAEKRFQDLSRQRTPGIVVSRSQSLPENLLTIASENEVTVFKTFMVTMNFINAATVRPDREFTPTITEHAA